MSTNEVLNNTNKTHFIYVAPSNSTYKEIADYICNGTNDAQQINAAIADAKSGTEIILLNGKFNICEKIIINKPDITIRGAGYSTVVEQVEIEGGTTSIIFDIRADRIKLKDMMLVDVNVKYSQYIIRTNKDYDECLFERIFFILKSTKTDPDTYIDLSVDAAKFINCRFYHYDSVPNKMTININGNHPLILGNWNTGNDTIKINFSNNTYHLIANDNTEAYINKIKQ